MPDPTNPLAALIPAAGVWIVASVEWIDGPGLAVPYPDEIAALRAANDAGWHQRAWFVPYGEDLRDVMNERWKAQSPNTTQNPENHDA